MSPKNSPVPEQLNAEYYRRKNLSNKSPAATMGLPPRRGHRQRPPLPTPPPPPPPPTPAPGPPPPLITRGLARRCATGAKTLVGKTLRVGGAAAGLLAAASLSWHYLESKQVDRFFGSAAAAGAGDEEKTDEASSSRQSQPKRVLVLPFDNLKVVERRMGGGNLMDLQSLLGTNAARPTVTVEAKELVDIIRQAAADPNVAALHADFGEGMRHPLGYGHTEEIRTAVRGFRDARRAPPAPTGGRDPVGDAPRAGRPPRTSAYGHAFRWGEYFLASAFADVHLQARGHLNLCGYTSTDLFLRGALEKYGIRVDVFRHGDYKNAPSIFTDKKYSKAHLESVKSMTASLNTSIQTCIQQSRGEKMNFDSVMWDSIFKFGSLTSANSKEIGLVDVTPPLDPLLSLVKVNKNEHERKHKKKPRLLRAGSDGEMEGDDEASLPRKKLEAKFGLHDSVTQFAATEIVSLARYQHYLNKREKIERRRKGFNDKLQTLADKSTATSVLLSALGWQPREISSAAREKEKVAVLTVDGAIDSALSYQVIRALRQIREDEDVRCMVLRVNSPGGSVVSSEAILEEIKLFEKPVICSMSNLAASAGYYISTSSEKIFALPTTLTGSIGVFALKFDASKWAHNYGVCVEHYPRGSHDAASHPLTPLTPGTRQNIARTTLDFYEYFKAIVATNRSLSAEEVERVARGRVWTGAQAKEVGLVDTLGGLECAIAYAKTAHTQTAEVEVEHWPKTRSYADMFQSLGGATLGRDEKAEAVSVPQFLSDLTELKFADKPHYMLTMDEKTAMELIMKGE